MITCCKRTCQLTSDYKTWLPIILTPNSKWNKALLHSLHYLNVFSTPHGSKSVNSNVENMERNPDLKKGGKELCSSPKWPDAGNNFQLQTIIIGFWVAPTWTHLFSWHLTLSLHSTKMASIWQLGELLQNKWKEKTWLFWVWRKSDLIREETPQNPYGEERLRPQQRKRVHTLLQVSDSSRHNKELHTSHAG